MGFEIVVGALGAVPGGAFEAVFDGEGVGVALSVDVLEETGEVGVADFDEAGLGFVAGVLAVDVANVWEGAVEFAEHIVFGIGICGKLISGCRDRHVAVIALLTRWLSARILLWRSTVNEISGA